MHAVTAFLRTIGEFAAVPHVRFGDGFFREHLAEMDAGNERGLAQMAAERSERATRA